MKDEGMNSEVGKSFLLFTDDDYKTTPKTYYYNTRQELDYFDI